MQVTGPPRNHLPYVLVRVWPFGHPSSDAGYAMLTKKGKYGLKALIHLACRPGELSFVSDVAQANNIPKKFLDAILAELRNAGFVYSRKGKMGGYTLARAPEEIHIGHVVRVLDGPLAPIPCASKTRYQPCDDCDVATCQIRHMMLDVRNAIAAVLDKTSLAQLRDGAGGMLDQDEAVGPAGRRRVPATKRRQAA
jgi:Rrf2 family protein